MKVRDDERAFREAVADGLSPKEATELLRVPKQWVKYFTRRLPRGLQPRREPQQSRELQPVMYQSTERFYQPVLPAPEQDEGSEIEVTPYDPAACDPSVPIITEETDGDV